MTGRIWHIYNICVTDEVRSLAIDLAMQQGFEREQTGLVYAIWNPAQATRRPPERGLASQSGSLVRSRIWDAVNARYLNPPSSGL
jgi:hypothetical protein